MSRPCAVSLWALVAMSWRSSRSEVRRSASGWGLLWESSSFVPWFILNMFRDVSGVVPEWPWDSGFMRKLSSLASAPRIWFFVLLNSCDNLLVTLSVRVGRMPRRCAATPETPRVFNGASSIIQPLCLPVTRPFSVCKWLFKLCVIYY